MNDPFEDGPVCDFCNLPVGEEEMLHPMYVGELSQPKPHYLSETYQSTREYRMNGKSANAYAALHKALKSSPDIDVELHDGVERIEEMGATSGSFASTFDDSTGAAEITIRPKNVTYEPDAEVCDTCAEMFRSLKE